MSKAKPRVRVLLKCSSCSYSFSRLFGQKVKNSTTCPKCLTRIIIRDCVPSDEDRANSLLEIHERKMKVNSRVMAKNSMGSMPSDGIKYDQVPVSRAEAKFKGMAAARGFKVHRPSWPDFLLEKNGKLYFAEVKSKKDMVSSFQHETFDLLEKYGIAVYLWRDDKESEYFLKRWEVLD